MGRAESASILRRVSTSVLLPTNLLRFNLITLKGLLNLVLICIVIFVCLFELVDQTNLVLDSLSLHSDLAIFHKLMGTRPAHGAFLYLELVFF